MFNVTVRYNDSTTDEFYAEEILESNRIDEWHFAIGGVQLLIPKCNVKAIRIAPEKQKRENLASPIS